MDHGISPEDAQLDGASSSSTFDAVGTVFQTEDGLQIRYRMAKLK